MLRFPFFLTELKQKLAAARQEKRKLRSSGKEELLLLRFRTCKLENIKLTENKENYHSSPRPIEQCREEILKLFLSCNRAPSFSKVSPAE